MQLKWKTETVQILVVERSTATEWLKRNTKNRRVRESNLTQYANDLKEGRWKLTTDAIGFDVNGVLVNGQHRLQAIVDTGVSAKLIVVTGLPADVRIDIDTHGRRNVADGLKLSDRADCVALNRGVNTAAGMWTRMMHGASSVKGSETRAELLEFIEQHKAAGLWTIEQFNRYPQARNVVVAPVLAAVARAYYHYQADLEELARFVEVLVTGMAGAKHDETVIRFRNLLTGTIGASSFAYRGNSNKQPTLYRRTCRVIVAFMNDESLAKFYDPERELFPLPGEHIDDSTVPSATGLPFGVVGNKRQPGTGRPRTDRMVAAQAH